MYYTLAPQGGGGDESSQTGGKLCAGGRGRRWAILLFHLPPHVTPPPRPGTRPGIMSIIGVPFLLSPGVRVVLHTPYS